MKRFIRTIAYAALSLCCIQPVNAKPQPVKARKKNPAADTRKVTVTISGQNGKKIKSSSFTEDTTGLAGKLKFDFSQGDKTRDGKPFNTITVYYNDDPKNPFSIDVTQDDVPEKSEIVIGNIERIGTTETRKRPTLEIDTSKARIQSAQKAATLLVSVKVPKDSGTWQIMSGSDDLTKKIAEENIAKGTDEKDQAILNKGTYGELYGRILIYKNKPTRIYARKGTSSTGIISLLSMKDIKAAESTPVLEIDEQGHATIGKKAADSGPRVEIVKALPRVTPEELPANVNLKLLLTSENFANYHTERFRPGWVARFYTIVQGPNPEYVFNQKVKNFMSQKLDNQLVNTLPIANQLAVLQNAGKEETAKAIKEKIEALQSQYAEIYQYLSLDSMNSTPVDIQTKIQKLHQSIIAAFQNQTGPKIVKPIIPSQIKVTE